MKKIVITGANGFVGSHVVDEYLAQSEDKYQVHCIVRSSSNLKWLADKNVTIHKCDFNDIASLAEAVQNSDQVIHVAGLVAAKSPEEFYEANVQATLNLAEACKKFSPALERFLLVSSQTASGPAKSLNQPTRPNDSCEPISSYGKSKLEAELKLLEEFPDLPITIIRPPAVFGPRDTAIFTVFQSISKGIASVIGFTPKYVTLVYVKELARGIRLAAESPNAKGKKYFLGVEYPSSWPELNQMLGDAYGKKPITLKLPEAVVLGLGRVTTFVGKFLKKPPVFDFEKANDFIQPYWTVDTSAAKQDFDFTHTTKLEVAFEETFQWYKKQGWIK